MPKKYGRVVWNEFHAYLLKQTANQVVWLSSVSVDVLIDAPEYLNVSHLRGHGLQPGEVELPEGDSPGSQPQTEQG